MIRVRPSFSKSSVFKMFYCLHKNTKRAFSTSFGLKSVFEKFRFCGGLVWTVGQTVKIKLRFQISLAKCGRGLSKSVRGTLRRLIFCFFCLGFCPIALAITKQVSLGRGNLHQHNHATTHVHVRLFYLLYLENQNSFRYLG